MPSMRAALIHELGQAPRPGKASVPEPGPGQALVEVTAAPINPIDVAIGNGSFYGGVPEPPYVPGKEGLGRVLRG
ncbi:MAG TPA: hypothetical protein VGR10_07680, partial [Thermoleophilaceae bacterium]|nr:hypothetical protein [Thermoleophilaceae bacterium]